MFLGNEIPIISVDGFRIVYAISAGNLGTTLRIVLTEFMALLCFGLFQLILLMFRIFGVAKWGVICLPFRGPLDRLVDLQDLCAGAVV